MSPPSGERMKPPASWTSRPRRWPMPWGRNTLVVAVPTASSALHVMMSASRRTSARRRWARRWTSRQSTPALMPAAEGLLHAVHALDQGGEVAVAVGIRARDVAGIAGELRARIDQKRMTLGRPGLLQYLVMQDGAALIEGDDGVVGEILLALARRRRGRRARSRIPSHRRGRRRRRRDGRARPGWLAWRRQASS